MNCSLSLSSRKSALDVREREKIFSVRRIRVGNPKMFCVGFKKEKSAPKESPKLFRRARENSIISLAHTHKHTHTHTRARNKMADKLE